MLMLPGKIAWWACPWTTRTVKAKAKEDDAPPTLHRADQLWLYVLADEAVRNIGI